MAGACETKLKQNRNCCNFVSVLLSHDATQSAVLSACPPVTVMYRDHVGWNTSKIISWLISIGCSLSADLNIVDLLQSEHPDILAGIGVGQTLIYTIIECGQKHAASRGFPATTRLPCFTYASIFTHSIFCCHAVQLTNA